MTVARRLVIGGRVQGVGFRMFAQAQAAVEGVHGFIRNLPDGRVEVQVEGDQESVDRVEGRCDADRRVHRIETVVVEPLAATYRATGFLIR